MNRRISNKFAARLTLILALLMLLPIPEIFGQTASGGTKKRKAVTEFPINGTVISPDGKPVGNALITANEGAIVTRSDKNGHFKVTSRMSSYLLVEAIGFEPLAYEIFKKEDELKLTLQSAPLYAGQLDKVNLPMDVQTKQRYLVGAVSGVSDDAIERFPEPLLSNTLQGQILGLYAKTGTGALGINSASLFIRGLHRNDINGGNQIVMLVDGVERDIDALLLEEIETVKVMKDATSKILYGPRAANGVLSVTTKRGKMHTRKINFTAELGVGLPVAYPKYLDSYDYATLYNEARVNDGLTPLYTDNDLAGYRFSKGPNDLRYPNVDYLDYFLSKNTDYRKTTLEFSGGNESMQYAFVAGYNGNTGLEKVGITPTFDRINVRGNLDMKITNHLKAFVGMGGMYDVSTRSRLSTGAQTFASIRDIRPNEFPLIIDQAYIPKDSLGYPALGGSYAHPANLYGSLVYGGKLRSNNMNGQLNLGINLDMSQFVKGLTLKGQLGFDNFFYGYESVATSVATYAQRWGFNPAPGKDTVSFQQLSKTAFTDQTTLGNSYNLRTTSFLLGADFERTFNESRLTANLFYYYMMNEVSGVTPNLQTANTALRVNYSLKDKYMAEIDLALMGSDKFPKNNRYFKSYAGGIGWIVSEENFLKGSNAVNYLKIKASGGLLGYDASTPYDLHLNRWADNGTYQLRPGNAITKVSLMNYANPNLNWEKNLEFNVGAEGLLFNRKLWMEANYFNETRSDIITSPNSLYSEVYGSLYSQMNIGKIQNQGFELEAKYMNKAGDFFYSLGVNGMYSKNKILTANEIEDPLDYRRTTGKPTDAMFGFVDNGLFRTQADLTNAPRQTLGYYTIGDIAYKDLNGDRIIDGSDSTMIGNSFPRFTLGLNIDLSYKGFALSLVGTSSLGVYSWLNNDYYWNYGENKYSDQALNRFHPVNNPDGTYPRLTTTAGSNDFVNSTFWLANTNFFRLKNVELSYTFGYNKPLGVVKKVKVFARGTNVVTISKVKGLDPEALDAGVNDYPLFSTYTMGINIVF